MPTGLYVSYKNKFKTMIFLLFFLSVLIVSSRLPREVLFSVEWFAVSNRISLTLVLLDGYHIGVVTQIKDLDNTLKVSKRHCRKCSKETVTAYLEFLPSHPIRHFRLKGC